MSAFDPTLVPPAMCSGHGQARVDGACQCAHGWTGGQCGRRASTGVPNRVCIATAEFDGVARGGIGTANTLLAQFLARRGVEVHVLYLDLVRIAPGVVEPARAKAEAGGLHWHTVSVAHTTAGPHTLALSRALLDFVHARPGLCTVLHYHEWMGLGYHLALAKAAGALRNVTLAVTAHGPHLWALGNQGVPPDVHDTLVSFCERWSVELADIVLAPSRYILEFMVSALGWGAGVVARGQVLPNLIPAGFGVVPTARTLFLPIDPALKEVVFFGKTDLFKGVDIFCDAMDLLAAEGGGHLGVTFLVRLKQVAGMAGDEYIRHRAMRWPRFTLKIISDYDQQQAVAYLTDRAAGRLAVMPSVIENSPYTVLECLMYGVPFVATAVGGTPELVHPDDRAVVLADRTPRALLAKIKQAMERGIVVPRPAFRLASHLQRWLDFHRADMRAAPPVNVPACPPATLAQRALRVLLLSPHTISPDNARAFLADLQSRSLPAPADVYLPLVSLHAANTSATVRLHLCAGRRAAVQAFLADDGPPALLWVTRMEAGTQPNPVAVAKFMCVAAVDAAWVAPQALVQSERLVAEAVCAHVPPTAAPHDIFFHPNVAVLARRERALLTAAALPRLLARLLMLGARVLPYIDPAAQVTLEPPSPPRAPPPLQMTWEDAGTDAFGLWKVNGSACVPAS